MAKKEKDKKSLLEIISKEYKYEGLILLILAIIGIVLGVMILIGTNNPQEGVVIRENVFFIGDYPKAFAWIVIVLGVVSFVLAIWPYLKPSVGEIKRVSWPTKKTMLENTVVVFAFILILSLLFVGYDALLNRVVELFRLIEGKLG